MSQFEQEVAENGEPFVMAVGEREYEIIGEVSVQGAKEPVRLPEEATHVMCVGLPSGRHVIVAMTEVGPAEPMESLLGEDAPESRWSDREDNRSASAQLRDHKAEYRRAFKRAVENLLTPEGETAHFIQVEVADGDFDLSSLVRARFTIKVDASEKGMRAQSDQYEKHIASRIIEAASSFIESAKGYLEQDGGGRP